MYLLSKCPCCQIGSPINSYRASAKASSCLHNSARVPSVAVAASASAIFLNRCVAEEVHNRARDCASFSSLVFPSRQAIDTGIMVRLRCPELWQKCDTEMCGFTAEVKPMRTRTRTYIHARTYRK